MVNKVISIYLFVGVMLLSFTFVYSFLRGKSSYAKVLGALSVTLQIYLLGYLVEINSSTLSEMLFWNQIQYFGIPFFPPLWLVVSMLYTGRGKYLEGYKSVLLFAIPLITFLMRLTNGHHYLFYSKIELQQTNGMNLMLLTKGPWYLVQTGYVLITLILCTMIYFQRYRKSIGDEKIQFRLLFLASTLPYVALILVMMNLGGIGIDYTALILPPCVFLINLALSRYNFLEIKVLARERVFEDSGAGLVLLNRFYHIVDVNEAGATFFRWMKTPLKENRLDKVLQGQPDILDCIRHSGEKVFHLEVEGEVRYISVNARAIQNKEETVGFLVTFEDVTEKELLRHKLIEMAGTDELSGLNNRRRFREHANEACQRAMRHDEKISVLMLDIDYFKKINDSFGHQAGDDAIRIFAEMLALTFRGTDIIGRMGGEEFAVIMAHADAEMAYRKAELFRRMVEEKTLNFDDQQVHITVSIGVAELNEATPNFDVLINRADNALYEAKRTGRNRTVVEGSPEVGQQK